MSLSKNFNPSLVLVQHRKTRPFITERLLMGRKESNQTNKINNIESVTIFWCVIKKTLDEVTTRFSSKNLYMVVS